jgi:hypothetical protein
LSSILSGWAAISSRQESVLASRHSIIYCSFIGWQYNQPLQSSIQ